MRDKDLLEIVQRIEHNRKKTKNEKLECWKPKRIEDYVVPEFRIPESRQHEKTKEQLSKVLAFIQYEKSIRCSDCCTGNVPISCTNKRLLSIWGSSMNISKAIKFMTYIGLIEIEDSTYQYNADQEGYNRCKLYRYYVENERLLETYCSNNNINVWKVSNKKQYTSVVKFFKIDSFDNEKVRISSTLSLLKPDNYSESEFESYLNQRLYENYPQLAHYQELADEINETYYKDYPELWHRFIPTFTYTKRKNHEYVSKIGIRDTNSYVSAKKEYSEDLLTRQEVLDKYGLNLEKDVKSSVPRLTLSLNTGTWIPEDIDIYESIHKLYSDEEYTPEIRNAIKSLHMSAYFDTDSKIATHISHRMGVRVNDDLRNNLKQLRGAVVKAEGGKQYGSEIFLHESCIYMDVTNELLKRGYFVWQVYDAWYCKKPGVTQEEFEVEVREIIAKCFINYINKYLKYPDSDNSTTLTCGLS